MLSPTSDLRESVDTLYPYPTQFALSLQHKDFRLILSEAAEILVSMPATAAAEQMYTAAMAKGMDEDFSIIIKFMRELAGGSA